MRYAHDLGQLACVFIEILLLRAHKIFCFGDKCITDLQMVAAPGPLV